jgi:hypothetical protein
MDDPTHDLEQSLVGAGPLVELRRRRVLRAGRATLVGLHNLLSIVYARMTEHGTHAMPQGTAHVIVWTTDDPEAPGVVATVERIVENYRPSGVLVTLEVRRAGVWIRLVGWAAARGWLRRSTPAHPSDPRRRR